MPRRDLLVPAYRPSPFTALLSSDNRQPGRHWAYGLFAALALFAGVMLGMNSANAATPAETYVQQNIDRGYAVLNNAALSDAQRRDQFRNFMVTLTDLRRIALFTLGQYGNSASKTDSEAFVAAFTNYAVAVYESRLGKYKGQTLKVTGSTERAADDVVVNADVIDPAKASAQPIKAAFRVRKTPDGRNIVTDMQVEGIWLAISQRFDFTSYLQQNGGSVPALTAHLVSQTEKIRTGAPVTN